MFFSNYRHDAYLKAFVRRQPKKYETKFGIWWIAEYEVQEQILNFTVVLLWVIANTECSAGI